MNNFVDFIVAIAKNASLEENFRNALSTNSTDKLHIFFKENGYTVDFAECTKIIENKDSIVKQYNLPNAAY